MSTATTLPRLDRTSHEPAVETTLLELVQVLSELTDDDHEVVAAISSLLEEGRVRLTGNFAGGFVAEA